MRSKNEPYSLQTAIFLVFDEWLNTRMQYASWNCGIDTNLKTYHCQFSSKIDNDYYHFVRDEINYRKEMEIYAISNCFAITKLMNLMLKQYPLSENKNFSSSKIIHYKRNKRPQSLVLHNKFYITYTRLLNMTMTSPYKKLIGLSQILQNLSDDTIDNEIQMDTQVTETMAATEHNEEELQRLAIREVFKLLDAVDGVAKLKTTFSPSNVSTSILGAHDLNRRYATCYDGPFISIILSDQMDSYMYDCFKRDFMDLIERLRINPAIIDFNLRRLRRIVERLQILQMVFSRRFTQLNNNNVPLSAQQDINFPNNLLKLDEIELRIGLEFFLQIDVNLFYMKTCTFRDAWPRSLDEGLFCKSQLPIVRYTFQPCQNISCTLCESSSTIIQFNSYRTHRFLNGYYAILNCPVTCETKNLIYTLTCPCSEYAFIGSTSSNISEVIESIRENSNQLMHETLISRNSAFNLHRDMNNFLHNQKEFIRLYQHSIRCPKAIQLFLHVNSDYDCFIPMTYDQARVDDRNKIIELSPVSNFNDIFIQHVPIPPNGYIFSNCQQEKQRKFLERSHLIKSRNEKLFTSVDFYNVSVIAVLPENCSTLLRQVLECLFATHPETKLNMFNLRTKDTYELYGLPYHRVWCENIILSSSTSS
ncbi:unnamed protein product [Rotaria sordida]|uniref:Uncharacterized protein n=1 Tax=Rotaria sordida TaxID=392033 RepID=A0A815E9E5_9BILA|nr:unnamed protein product [Rotaria sordida]CAF1580719.1 unnamed protein product [Rotaria sordida]